jgi:hypothetical protein
MTSAPTQTKTKASVELVDRISVADEPLKPQYGVELDKFGAAAKTDPAEIALVKKIDLYMLVSRTSSMIQSTADNSSLYFGSCM